MFYVLFLGRSHYVTCCLAYAIVVRFCCAKQLLVPCVVYIVYNAAVPLDEPLVFVLLVNQRETNGIPSCLILSV